jgi:integrase
MSITGWQNARHRIGLPQLRIHDLKHTFGKRLRSAGVPLATRNVLLGHRNGDITTHYSAAEPEKLIEAAHRVCEQKSGTGCSEAENEKPPDLLSR